jgi:hypothetical protein
MNSRSMQGSLDFTWSCPEQRVSHDVRDGKTCIARGILAKESRPDQPDQARGPIGALKDIMSHCLIDVLENILTHGCS